MKGASEGCFSIFSCLLILVLTFPCLSIAQQWKGRGSPSKEAPGDAVAGNQGTWCCIVWKGIERNSDCTSNNKACVLKGPLTTSECYDSTSIIPPKPQTGHDDYYYMRDGCSGTGLFSQNDDDVWYCTHPDSKGHGCTTLTEDKHDGMTCSECLQYGFGSSIETVTPVY